MTTGLKETQPLGDKIISFDETLLFFKSLDTPNSHTIICFEGPRGMDLYSENLKKILEEEKKCPVQITDGYRLKNLNDFPEGVCIIREFHDFDEERMQLLLDEVEKRPNLSWVLLIPTWKHISLPGPLKKWLEEKKINKFRILAVPIPKPEPMKLKGEMIWINPYFFPQSK